MSKAFSKRNLWAPLFLPLTILYEELLLRLFSVDAARFDYHLLYLAVFAAAFGSLFYAIAQCPKSRKLRLVLTGLFAFVPIVVFCAEYCAHSYFQIFFEVGYMLSMSGNVTADFGADTVNTVIHGLPYIFTALIPMVILAWKHKKIVPAHRSSKKQRALSAGLFAVLEIGVILLLLLGNGDLEEDREYFTAEYAINPAITRFGLMCSLQLEGVYGIFGVPEFTPGIASDPTPSAQPTPAVTPDPVYGANVQDIDFKAIGESTNDKLVQEMSSYFAAKTPTDKNQYTGMFEGKNLIFIVAESFSPYAVSEELTPTLYKLSTEGFVFTDFYQPDWHQSTTGGEFAAVSGLLPTNVNGALSFLASARKSMPYALGNQFMELGYATRAYHNNTWNFYERHRTHPNLGYVYKGCGNGLNLISRSSWPNSDHEMILVTADEYIDNYVNNGEKFHTYYMTVSGHGAWGFGAHKMCEKHEDEVAHLTQYSTPVRAYIASQLELELAMTELMNKLEAAGIADDTVIALTSDHYPYKLTSKEYHELEPVDTGDRDMLRYRNSFMLWCGSMEEPIVIDDPCSSIDIIPTLSNLFGLEYDSRLFSGRDILSTNYNVSDPNSPQPFVVGVDGGIGSSWISLAGSYDSFTDTFTPNPGYEEFDNEEYIDAMKDKAKEMFKYAKNILYKDYYKLVEEQLNPSVEEPI
ncbi:MAG: LTA synthase family protein [Oscillospiraceae bacterium]|nr:LTA synthase family protein [Oscillospiraceae bacterium]